MQFIRNQVETKRTHDSIINCPSKSHSQSERNEKRYYLDFISEVRNLLDMESCQSLAGNRPKELCKKCPEDLEEDVELRLYY